MLVDIVSDFHVEFSPDAYKRILKDSFSKKIIIAGDMGPVKWPDVQQAFVWLANKYEEIIYVPGNHDYYGQSIYEGNLTLQSLEDLLPSLTILRPGNMAVIGNKKVIGDTLWVKDVPELKQYLINDPYQIPGLYSTLGEMNKKASEFIYENADSDTIVVTHHLPHLDCVAPQYRSERTNCWFVSDESRTFEDKKPFMWIFGHSHVRSDFMIGSTRVINQAYGYPSEYKPFARITYDI